MRVLVIGGTGFIGPHLVRRLAEMGHEVAVFHRGSVKDDLPAEHILGNRADLRALCPRAEIVVDLILSSAAQARATVETFRGVAYRVVAASSMDVYRACGVFHGLEEGPLEPVPLTEESALRSKMQTYPPSQIQAARAFYPWLDDDYDKIPVERVILGNPDLAGTICRLPMVYGPGDPVGRFYPIVKRIADGRRVILLEEGLAQWRSPRGYVENVAAALALAATDERAAGRIYNVGETPSYSELEWARKIGASMHWTGEFRVLPKDRTPAHLIQPGNTAQHWAADSSRIRLELGYREPVPLEEAIRRTIAWETAALPREFSPYRFDYPAEDAALTV